MLLFNKIKQIITNYGFNRVVVMKQGEIQAVHDDDLEMFLKSIGEYERVASGEVKCHFCGCVVNLDNLECIFPYEGDVSYCCSNTVCYEKLIALGEIQK